MPTAEASTAASTTDPGGCRSPRVKPHVSSTTNAAGGAEATSTATKAPAHRRSIHAVARRTRDCRARRDLGELCARPY